MAQLDSSQIKKLRRGELCGNIAVLFCAAVLIYFAVLFSVSWIKDDKLMQTVVFSTAPPLAVLGTAIAAFCNIKFGRKIDSIVDMYIRDTFVENAALMHPERNSLSFYVNLDDKKVEITVNDYKEKIIFDFSPFGRIGPFRKASILSAVDARLIMTFMRLWERGSEYKYVAYRERDGLRRKSGKLITLIADGKPQKAAVKYYMQHK